VSDEKLVNVTTTRPVVSGPDCSTQWTLRNDADGSPLAYIASYGEVGEAANHWYWHCGLHGARISVASNYCPHRRVIPPGDYALPSEVANSLVERGVAKFKDDQPQSGTACSQDMRQDALSQMLMAQGLPGLSEEDASFLRRAVQSKSQTKRIKVDEISDDVMSTIQRVVRELHDRR